MGEHTCGHMLIDAQVHTHKYIHTHALCTRRTHTHPHTCTLRCVCTHIHTQMYTHVQVHTHTHTHALTSVNHDFTAEATGAFPVGDAFYYSVYFPSLQWEITQNRKNHSSWPQMDGWSTPGAPGNSFHPAGVCNSVESWSTASFSHWPLVGVCSSWWLQFAGTKIYNAQCSRRCNLPPRRDNFCSQENVFPPLAHLYI